MNSPKTGFQLSRDILPVAAILCALLANPGCDSSRSGGSGEVSTLTHEKWMEQNEWTQVTDAEAETFAGELEQSIERRDLASFSRLANLSGIARFSASGLLKGRNLDGFARGFSQAESSFFSQLSTEGDSYRIIGTKPWKGGQGVIARLVDSEGACNYHHWYLAKDSAHQVFAVDFYVFMSGENMSETFRRLLFASRDAISPSVLDRLSGRARSMAEQGESMMKFMEACGQGRYQQALTYFEGLPTDLQEEKAIQLNRLLVTMQIENDAEYARAIEDYQRLFPDDPSLDFICLDLHFMNEEYEKAVTGIDNLLREIGEDAHMLALKATALTLMEKFDQAETIARRAVELEPDYELGVVVLVPLLARSGDFEEVNRAIRTLMDQFGYTISDVHLRDDPVFSDYLESDEYRELLDR